MPTLASRRSARPRGHYRNAKTESLSASGLAIILVVAGPAAANPVDDFLGCGLEQGERFEHSWSDLDGTTAASASYQGTTIPEEESSGDIFNGRHFHQSTTYSKSDGGGECQPEYTMVNHGGDFGVSSDKGFYDCEWETIENSDGNSGHPGQVRGDGSASWTFGSGLVMSAESRHGCEHDGFNHDQTEVSAGWSGDGGLHIYALPCIADDGCDELQAILEELLDAEDVSLELNGVFGG